MSAMIPTIADALSPPLTTHAVDQNAPASKPTPTFLSTESLTFPGVSLISLGLVQIWNKATGTQASAAQIAIMAGILGSLLIVWGLMGTTLDRGNAKNITGQIIIGFLNTMLLYGVMLGVTGA